MGREIRRVPLDWEPPLVGGGPAVQPMHAESLAYRVRRIAWETRLCREGIHIFQLTGMTDYDPADDYLLEPSYLHPEWPAESMNALRIYENTSEGTPVSPAFPDENALLDWLLAREWDPADAERFIRHETVLCAKGEDLRTRFRQLAAREPLVAARFVRYHLGMDQVAALEPADLSPLLAVADRRQRTLFIRLVAVLNRITPPPLYLPQPRGMRTL